MSKVTSILPFSPDKGKPVPLDPAFEFEAPRFCDLEDENYDFFEDYEKNVWFEETHWLHEPPEKRPVDKSKRAPTSFAAAAIAAKKQLSALTGLSENGRSNSENGKTSTENGKSEFEDNEYSSVLGSPMGKLKGPERILFKSENKENVLNFDQKDDLEESVKPVRARKSIMPRAIRTSEEEKTTKNIYGNRTSGGGDDKIITKGRKSIMARTSEEDKTKDIKSKKPKISDGEQQKIVRGRKSIMPTTVASRVSDDSKVNKEVKIKSGKISGDGDKIIKSRKSIMPSTAKATEEKKIKKETKVEETTIKRKASGEGENDNISSSISSISSVSSVPASVPSSPSSSKIRARKSISMSTLAFLNNHSTGYTSNIPVLKSSSSSSLLSSSSSSSSSSSASSSSSPSLSSSSEAPKGILSLPVRLNDDEENEDENDENINDNIPKDNNNIHNNTQKKEKEKAVKEVETKKRKSGDVLATEKSKRSRSSIISCPAPSAPVPAAKKKIPVIETATATTKPMSKNKRKELEFELDQEVAALLERHNKKFKPVAVYVPRNFSTKDVKIWEEYSGKKWYALTAAEREEANNWIKQMKKEIQQ